MAGENKLMTVERTNLRKSKDWIDNKWVDVMPKPNILQILTSRLNPMPKVSLPIFAGKGVAGSSKVGGTEAVDKQLPSSSSSGGKKAVEDDHVKELLKIKRTEDWSYKKPGVFPRKL